MLNGVHKSAASHNVSLWFLVLFMSGENVRRATGLFVCTSILINSTADVHSDRMITVF